MNKNIWIITITILAIIIFTWFYMNRRIDEDIGQQEGTEVFIPPLKEETE